MILEPSYSLSAPAPGRSAGDQWVLLAVGLSALCLGAAIGLGSYWVLLTLPVAAFAVVAFARPHVFFGLSLILYSLMQVGLVQTEVLALGGIAVNASQVYVMLQLALLGAGVLVQRAAGRLGLARPLPSMWALALLGTWLAIDLIPSQQMEIAAGSIARHLAGLVVFYLAYCLASDPRHSFWVRAGVVGSAVIAATSTILQSSSGNALAEDPDGVFRAGGTFGGPVQAGTICFMGLAFFVSALPGLGGRARLLTLGAIALSGLGMLATLSRTAVIGVAMFSVLLIWGRTRSRGGRLKFFLYNGVTLAAIALAILVTPEESIRRRTADLPFLGEGEVTAPTTGSGRTLIWGATIEALMESTPGEWLLGRGINAVSASISPRIQVDVGAHNSYLQVLFDAGLIGLLLYVTAIGLVLHDLKRAGDEAEGRMQDTLRIWLCYMVAYFLSTEMFNAYVYVLGPRFFTFIILGAYLGHQAARSSRVKSA